jgi:hypothetical protein
MPRAVWVLLTGLLATFVAGPQAVRAQGSLGDLGKWGIDTSRSERLGDLGKWGISGSGDFTYGKFEANPRPVADSAWLCDYKRMENPKGAAFGFVVKKEEWDDRDSRQNVIDRIEGNVLPFYVFKTTGKGIPFIRLKFVDVKPILSDREREAYKEGRVVMDDTQPKRGRQPRDDDRTALIGRWKGETQARIERDASVTIYEFRESGTAKYQAYAIHSQWSLMPGVRYGDTNMEFSWAVKNGKLVFDGKDEWTYEVKDGHLKMSRGNYTIELDRAN